MEYNIVLTVSPALIPISLSVFIVLAYGTTPVPSMSCFFSNFNASSFLKALEQLPAFVVGVNEFV